MYSPVRDDVFTDSDVNADDNDNRKRLRSVPELIQNAEELAAKRQAAAFRSSPPGGAPVMAAPRVARSASAALARPPPGHPASRPVDGGGSGVELSAGALAAIRELIQTGNASVIATLEARFEHLEKRIEVVEHECMEKDLRISALSEQLESQMKVNASLQEQIESIDNNRRLSSLILTCREFERRSKNEDVEAMVVQALNRRFPQLSLSETDIQVAHRLQNESKLYVKFVKRHTRDRVFDCRFEGLRGSDGGTLGASAARRGDERAAPLYINESLTRSNRMLYDELLEARKPCNGALIATVFSRRGVVFCRKEHKGTNIMVPDVQAITRVLGGRRFRLMDHRASGRRGPPGPRSATPVVRRGGGATSAPKFSGAPGEVAQPALGGSRPASPRPTGVPVSSGAADAGAVGPGAPPPPVALAESDAAGVLRSAGKEVAAPLPDATGTGGGLHRRD